MKKTLLFPLYLLFSASLFAQEGGFVGLQPIAAFSDTPGNPLHEYVKTYKHTDIPQEYTGSFYAEEEFVPGTVVVEGEDKQLEVLLRYNAVADAVEVKLKDKDSVYVLPNLKNLVYKTPGYSYQFNSYKTKEGDNLSGFFIHYYDGDDLKFLSKPMAHMKKEVQPRSGYDRYKPAHYSIKEFYYLLDNSGRLKEVDLKEKDFRKELSDQKGMKQYFSDHKVKKVEDVVAMLKFLEQQENL